MGVVKLQKFIHRVGWVVRNAPNLLQGYNIYVNAEKLRLIDRAFRSMNPSPRSFADLGGVWKVNGAYTTYTLRNFDIARGVIVDTNYPQSVSHRLGKFPQLVIVQGDFTAQQQIDQVKRVDMVYMFDVLLHQANPDWNQVLAAYAGVTNCLVIFNQQYVIGPETVRLTDLSLEEYMHCVPTGGETFYRTVYRHKTEMHPIHGKPWGDIHNIFQWGITDRDLRSVMASLGFAETWYCNHGRFSSLPAFENHAFIFMRERA